MKRFNTLYYLLFVMLIMGAFASMAQNNYGITIMGIVAFAFSFLFLIQLVPLLAGKQAWDLWSFLELISISLLAIILGLRVFYIHFAFVEWVFGLSGLILVIVYAKKLLETYRELKTRNQWITRLVLFFHFSIIGYTLSMATVPFIPAIAEPAGLLAFVLLIAFVAGSILKKNLMLDGEKISGISFVGRFKDRSVVILSLFLLFTLYMGLTKVGFLPKMYSNEFPKSYFQLVDQAEQGREKPVSGQYKHEQFKAKYDQFVERNASE